MLLHSHRRRLRILLVDDGVALVLRRRGRGRDDLRRQRRLLLRWRRQRLAIHVEVCSRPNLSEL